MEQRLYEMYLELPEPSEKLLYIPGYTETLECIEGARIVPSLDYYEAVPYQFRKLFDVMIPPFYYIPIKMDSTHYGFILKGADKLTSKFSTFYPFFNLDALLSDKPYVFVVEGIKDAGIFLLRGHPAISMLTSGMSDEHLQMFSFYDKTPVFVPDNDPPGAKSLIKMKRYLDRQRYPCFSVTPRLHKDMGNFFDRPDLATYVESTYGRALSFASVGSPRLVLTRSH
jgi:hypothetical protein